MWFLRWVGVASLTVLLAACAATGDGADDTGGGWLDNGLVGEAEYAARMSEAHKAYKAIPTPKICQQATQEIAESWAVYELSRDFLQQNVDRSNAGAFWKSFTGKLYKSVDNVVPLPLPDLPQDRLVYAAKQLEFSRTNIEKWSAIHRALCN